MGFLAVLLVAGTMGVILLVFALLPQANMEYALPHPIPRPDVPAELMNLPTEARVHCPAPIAPNRSRITDQDFVDVWTLPGNYPRPLDDSESWPPSSIKGHWRGRILRCTEVQAISTGWSEFDGEFYVWARPVSPPIRDEDREFWQWIKSEQADGYVRFSQLEFR